MSDAARRILLTILFLGIAGISLELWLMAHTEDFYQLIPLWLAGMAIVASLLVVLRPSPGTIRLFPGVRWTGVQGVARGPDDHVARGVGIPAARFRQTVRE